VDLNCSHYDKNNKYECGYEINHKSPRTQICRLIWFYINRKSSFFAKYNHTRSRNIQVILGDVIMTKEMSLKPEIPTSEEEGRSSENSEILSDSERRAKFGVNGSRRAALSKREMMERLSQERFPWEE
jgi:hypothetical protein